ncbi:MAG: sigma-70 family RNA polymerase sigma factor [Synergistota bacterium]|nr:sigma-70 family RNA polymerase sigma factor [Synergistota bacterium]
MPFPEGKARGFVERAKCGDEPAMDSLMLICTPAVRRIALTLRAPGSPDFDDLLQEGLIAIFRSVDRYIPDRGPYGAFAYRAAKNAMISSLRRKGFSSGDVAEETITCGDETTTDRVSLRMELETLTERLSTFEVAVLDAYLFTGSVKEAAGLLETPARRIENALQRIKRKASRDL